ncbi:apurinic endonuclease-redox [Chlorella sorokiniana]|uniref:Apurinic endonuclease-redox n=1 Tax=Chlorella sorokiniana TaxID=3076 RepID=A0A2P6TLU2_CHLSO|nr:apurinic endonuclease-redox [Chlorella sorokiniana]|eukprot:PRW45261.1 apurinic endonuclease-redox [Chlorella sorokiniana]
MRPPPLAGDAKACRILSWNVAGLRALLKKVKEAQEGRLEQNVPSLPALVEAEKADVLCLQEIKLQADHCEGVLAELGLPGWHVTWNCSKDKKGYSGTAILSKDSPLSVSCGIGDPDHDGEGRVVTAEFDQFFLVNTYVPNSGEGLKRLDYRVQQWDKEFAAYLQGLQQRKPVVLTGDLNVAPTDIDIHNPKGNLKSAGFTPEERASFADNLLAGCGLVDTFRAQHPEAVGYTYWSYRFNARANNRGWRLDHFLVSQALHERVHDCYLLPGVMGSDHCPLGLVLKMD